MTNDAFYNIVCQAVQILRDFAPKRTGNLAYDAIRMEFRGNEAIIYVDEEIAPYMPFTNEKWVAERWHGKENPNENWFDDAGAYIAYFLNSIFQGSLKVGEN